MGLSNEKQTIAPEHNIESTLHTMSSNICWMANNKEIANDYKERMIRYILEIDLDLYEPTQYYQKEPYYHYEPSRYEMNLNALCDVNWTGFEYDFDLILRLPLFSASFYNWSLCTQPVNFVAAYLSQAKLVFRA